eukprot:TRINITY_DN8885_c0_g1_i21.p1 TRINITY_DN8885_c0_g1~~TRINITY_DN8885_c0_g1_i21.p1  ORF type:complete len:339 (-),score=67.41 TRINITY_DN8885_c0_g1_i21:188-1204(-)
MCIRDSVKGLAHQCAWYETIADTGMGEKIRTMFGETSQMGNFPEKFHFLLRWLIFWVGRSLMFFGIDFIQNTCPQLCPPSILEPASIAQFKTEFEEALYYFPEIMCHLLNKDTFLYGHPNLCVDNAFFYRDETGEGVECGGLDFGLYGKHKTVVHLSGLLGTADEPYHCQNRERLVRLFCEEYTAKSGKHMDPDATYEDYELMNVMKCLLCAVIAVAKVPSAMDMDQLKACPSERDPPMVDNFYGRSFTKLIIASYIRWKHGHAYDSFRRWADREDVSPGFLGTLGGWLFYWPWRPFHSAFMSTQVFLYNRSLLGASWGLAGLAGLGYVGTLIYRSWA